MVFGSHPLMVGTGGVPWSPRFFGSNVGLFASLRLCQGEFLGSCEDC